MQHFRRTLLTILVLAVVSASLVGFPGVSSAASTVTSRDTMVPAGPSPQRVPDPNNTGEPDSGSTRSKQLFPAVRNNPVDDAQYAVRALRTIRWTSFVWAKRIFGVGE
jgi:hypothetical protein